jgi:hypothetical protein
MLKHTGVDKVIAKSSKQGKNFNHIEAGSSILVADDSIEYFGYQGSSGSPDPAKKND